MIDLCAARESAFVDENVLVSFVIHEKIDLRRRRIVRAVIHDVDAVGRIVSVRVDDAAHDRYAECRTVFGSGGGRSCDDAEGCEKEERAFLYFPAFSSEEWERRRAGDLVAGFLAGPQPSRDLLLSSLVEAVGQHDAVLLDELEAKIRKKRQELSRAAK